MHPANDTDGFTEAYQACLPMLIGLIIRYLGGSRDEIQDVLQDIWVKGAEAWPPRQIAFARSWLGRIAINEALNRGRRASRSPFIEPKCGLDALVDRADPGPAPDELFMHRDLRRAIERLESRSPRQVAVLKMVYLEGCTYLEAAAALDIAEGTAKSQTFKAIENLRLALIAPKAA